MMIGLLEQGCLFDFSYCETSRCITVLYPVSCRIKCNIIHPHLCHSVTPVSTSFIIKIVLHISCFIYVHVSGPFHHFVLIIHTVLKYWSFLLLHFLYLSHFQGRIQCQKYFYILLIGLGFILFTHPKKISFVTNECTDTDLVYKEKGVFSLCRVILLEWSCCIYISDLLMKSH